MRTVVFIVGDKYFEELSEAQKVKRRTGGTIKVGHLTRLPNRATTVKGVTTNKRQKKPPVLPEYDPSKPLDESLREFI